MRTMIMCIVFITCLSSLALGTGACRSEHARRRDCAPNPQLIRAMEHEDRRMLREFAWRQVADITRAANNKLVEWQTWEPKKKVLGGFVDKYPDNFDRPVQLFEASASLPAKKGPPPPSLACQLGCPPRPSAFLANGILVDVRYSKVAAEHVKTHCLGSYSRLFKMYCCGVCSERGREIPQFCFGSRLIKAVWWPVKLNAKIEDKKTLCCVPVWDRQPTRPVEAGIGGSDDMAVGNDAFQWRRRVAIGMDCDGKYPAFADVIHPDWRCNEAKSINECLQVVPLSHFYSYQLTEEDTKNKYIKQVFEDIWWAKPEADDLLVLVGFHISSKDHDDWMWTTLWWHDNPDCGPFSADRLAPLPEPWKNYLMDVTYMDDTPNHRDRGERPMYNPWLEAPLQNGLKSNCISCHQRASWSPHSFDGNGIDPSSTVLPGVLSNHDNYFEHRLRLDYVWSLRNPRADSAPPTSQPSSK